MINGSIARRQEVVSLAQLKGKTRGVHALRALWRYRGLRLEVPRIDALGKPFLTCLAARLFARGPVTIADPFGPERRIDAALLKRLACRWLRSRSGRQDLARNVIAAARAAGALPRATRFDASRGALYLRTDLVFGVRAGGSLAHIAGVVNRLGRALMLTTDRIDGVDCEQRLLPLPTVYLDDRESAALAANAAGIRAAIAAARGMRAGWVYQRTSLGNITGLVTARRLGIPLICEYNGSDIWLNRHWGRRLSDEASFSRIESLNLAGADLVVVVSEAMRAEVAACGVEARRILVNPNGVDTRRYRPDIDPGPVRRSLGLGDAVVMGFIGTFGPWHGVEDLVEAVGDMIARRADLRGRMRLLLIGDGAAMPEVRRRIAARGLGDTAICTGLVPQSRGPDYLAACDILCSPTRPNPDGSEFFGSPIKLYEYLAMGRAIIASDLAQLGDVLKHDETALLTRPGDIAALSAGIERLCNDAALRQRLGAAARDQAERKHTWELHADRTLERLREVIG